MASAGTDARADEAKKWQRDTYEQVVQPHGAIDQQ